MTVSVITQKMIWGLFAARCAICRKKLAWESKPGGRSLIGEIAHIVGAKLSASRGRAHIAGDRNDPENLLLLCRDHHKIVDDNEEEYTVERLRQIRSDFLSWLEGQLTPAQRWSAGVISQYTYLNVPRLDEFAVMRGYQIRHVRMEPATHLSELGFGLNRLMSQYHKVLDNLPMEAHPAEKIEFAHDGYVGRIVSFDRLRFRNRNVPLYRPEGQVTPFTGDLDLDPHIYHAFADWRLVININPKWITTSTAYTLGSGLTTNR
ncbi:HNH endonuclease [Tabrizicola fusiformis]|uniref:HNH endonuclease n=1 Tax=Tabrizicola sp. SY72 TaxID=2741673 RepID=UPI00157465B6|nr:HNH endonuclease [Tabrizicola sp. SY72]NTT86621.1 HNH endonuclease [Tabrizicola sp. SY72]